MSQLGRWAAAVLACGKEALLSHQSAAELWGIRGRRAGQDFFWSAFGLVVETDGLRYHRTPSPQARDRRRDQAHTAGGLTTLRFTHAQVSLEPRQVNDVLQRVIAARRSAA